MLSQNVFLFQTLDLLLLSGQTNYVIPISKLPIHIQKKIWFEQKDPFNKY